MTSQNIHLSSKSTIPQFVLQLYEVFTNKNGSFRSHHLSRSLWPTMIYTHTPFVSSEICVCCSAYSRINYSRKFFWPKYLAISWTPYLGEIWPVLSLICSKNRSAYRQINTVTPQYFFRFNKSLHLSKMHCAFLNKSWLFFRL